MATVTIEPEEEVEEEVEEFECENCGYTYEDEDEAATCCYECSDCGDTYSDPDEAENCCVYYCQECGEGYSCCDSADECCDSSGEMGNSSTAPWVARGHKFSSTENGNDMIKAIEHWGITNRPNVNAQAADFYLLEIITNDLYKATGERAKHLTPEVAYNMRHMFDMTYDTIQDHADSMNLSPFEKIMADAAIQAAIQVDMLDPILLAYCQMAIGGELRHHKAVGGVVIDPPARRAGAWIAWKEAVEEVGPQIFLDAAELFREIGGNTYGGEKWAVPCEIVNMRMLEELGPTPFMNRKLFIDRVWTLEHNGGCFLNKIDWPKGLNLRTILDAHASNPEQLLVLWSNASADVKEMFSTYMKLVQENNPNSGCPEFDTVFLNSIITYCRFCLSDANYGHHLGCRYMEDPDCERTTTGADFLSKYPDTQRFHDKDTFFDTQGKIAQSSYEKQIVCMFRFSAHEAHNTLYFGAPTINAKLKNVPKNLKKMKMADCFGGFGQWDCKPEKIKKISFEVHIGKGNQNHVIFETVTLTPGQAAGLETMQDVHDLMTKKVA